MGRETSILGQYESFPETLGTLLADARNPRSVRYREALNRLVQLYWRPVYALVRKHGLDVEDAKDLTQQFMMQVVEGTFLSRFKREKGRFRDYIKGAVRLAVAQRKRSRARRRRVEGWPIDPASLADLETPEFIADMARRDPEEIFDRQLAQEVMARSIRRVRRELELQGMRDHFETFKAYDLMPLSQEQPSYESVARQLKTTADHVRKRLELVRKRLNDVLVQAVAEMAGSEEEMAEEMALHRACWMAQGMPPAAMVERRERRE